MMTDHHHSTKSLVEFLGAIASRKEMGVEEFNLELNNLILEVEKFAKTDNSNAQEILDRKRHANWINSVMALKENYARAVEKASMAIDKDRAISRLEARANIRATVFRFLQTLGVGIAIMIVYWLAASYEIAMPLMRIPL